jgi:tRNA A37 threonylcarbamoyladenosine modification protein TsaB
MAGLLGWGVAAGLPIQIVDSFAAMRASVPDTICPLLIVIHSRGEDFYMQYLESRDSDHVSEPFIGSVESLVDLPAVRCKVCGPGAQRLLELLHNSDRDGYESASADYLEPDMEAVCTTALKLFCEREVAVDDYRIEPFYMTLSQAQINFESRERRL